MVNLVWIGDEMSEKIPAIAFLIGTLCLAILATIIFPDLPGLP
jgi:hypothetical protein